jgi:hypothetical protein
VTEDAERAADGTMSDDIEALRQQEREWQQWQRCTAVHESGHCIAAIWVAPPIPLIRASIQHDPVPQVTIGAYPRHEHWGWWLGLFTLVALAAEELFCDGPIEDSVVRSHDQRARRYLVIDNYCACPEAMESLHNQARWLVRTPWARRGIERIATALVARGSLSGDEIRSLCGDPHRTTGADWKVEPDQRRDGL